jgi:sulfatase maturation enzyme AslB (radical SAM superfamily)
MCNSDSSSEWKKEVEQFPELKKWTNNGLFTEYSVTSQDNFEQLKNIPLDKCRLVCFTGGEPLLIKHYYDFMDHMIDKGYNETVGLEFFTNCSVWNPLFIDRMMKFKTVRVVMSIDAYGKTAEYQRHGTDWATVEKNIFKFVQLPKNIFFNSAISAYTLLDFYNHSKFLMKLYDMNNMIGTRCYSVTAPFSLHFVNLNDDLRNRALEQIDKSIEILKPNNFEILRKELNAIKNHIINTKPERPELFVSYTKVLDKVRNEKFEEVFDYKLY